MYTHSDSELVGSPRITSESCCIPQHNLNASFDFIVKVPHANELFSCDQIDEEKSVSLP